MVKKKDTEFLVQKGIDPARARRQIEMLKRGTRYAKLIAPARRGQGIWRLTGDEERLFGEHYDRQATQRRVTKFIPASGAATRMFRTLTRYLDLQTGQRADMQKSELDQVEIFFQALKDHKFALEVPLADRLKSDGSSINRLLSGKDRVTVLRMLLTEEGLNYAAMPKGLVKFHKYETGQVYSAFLEHIREAASFGSGIPDLHFTIPAGTREEFEEDREEYGRQGGNMVPVEYSCQQESTDTLALDSEGDLLRDNEGFPVLRPGGHGALIENLDDLAADIVLIRNIDNVPRAEYHGRQVYFHKVLAGILLDLQNRIHNYLKKLEESGLSGDTAAEVVDFLENRLYSVPAGTFLREDPGDLKSRLRRRLDRPLRVCGVVPNQGQPGGGPFWVGDGKGGRSLQIVENAQVDPDSDEQSGIWQQATHFNPVNFACALRDYENQSFSLGDYVDETAYFVARKSRKGRSILALEHPGLWNGGMAGWHTVLVEIPADTFNPVKEINDLLTGAHVPAGE